MFQWRPGQDAEYYEARALAAWGVKRKAWTVGELRSLIEGVDDETAVVVSHQPRNHRIGVQDPIVHVAKLFQQEWDGDNCRMFLNGQFREALVIE